MNGGASVFRLTPCPASFCVPRLAVNRETDEPKNRSPCPLPRPVLYPKLDENRS